MFEEIKGCRICKEEYSEVLNLGWVCPSTFLKPGQNLDKAPLVLVQCNNCKLVQLKHTVDLDSMYREYWYRSSLNQSMIDSLWDLYMGIEWRQPFVDGDTVIDIGCNDGTLLNFFPETVFKVGVDPALNLGEEAEQACDLFINDYFSAEALPPELPKAKVITSIAMFYDLPDPHAFVEDICKVLHKEGMWVIQLMDLKSMLETNGFDNICHEHLEYYSLKVINNLLKEHSLEIFDVGYNRTNGGSLRLHVGWQGQWHNGYSKIPLVAESNYLYNNPMQHFAEKVEEIKENTMKFLDGKEVYGLGASTKANTLLQYFGLDYMQAIGEIHKDKIGLITPGTNIPIVPEQEVLNRQPECLVLLIWQFADNILPKLNNYVENGGTVVQILPEPLVITERGKCYLKTLL